MIADKKMQLHK